MVVPPPVRTVTVSAAVVPVFIKKVFKPFGAVTTIDAGAFGSVADEPHPAQIASSNP